MVDLKNIVRNVDSKHKSKVGHLVGIKHVDSVDSIIANGKLSARRSQPSSPRSKPAPSSRTGPVPVPVPASVPLVPHQHSNDSIPTCNDSVIDMSLPLLNPQPPTHTLSGTSMSLNQPLAVHPTIRVPGQKATAGQRPSQYRTGGARQQVTRSSTSEQPTRPQSGSRKNSGRAPSPIVTSSSGK